MTVQLEYFDLSITIFFQKACTTHPNYALVM